MTEYIQFRDLTKIFPGQKALDHVSFSIAKGEIHAVLGENGAGKSTLLNVLHGVFPASSGDIVINGKKVYFAEARDAIDFGIAKVHQEINLVGDMSVMDNLLLGKEPVRGPFLDRSRMMKETQRLLDTLQCRFTPLSPVRSLNVGEKQMLQVAKALHMEASVVSFDEPTSSLSKREVDALFRVIRELKARGITVIYISHKLDEIYELCDRATILRDGSCVGTYSLTELHKDELIRKMVGRDVAIFAKRHKPTRVETGEEVLRVAGLCGAAGFSDVGFSLHRGEILGFFGLVGAKRTEVMRGIFGADPLSAGTVELHGKRIGNAMPSEAVANGIAMIPENRKEHGFVKDFNNMDNIALAALRRFDAAALFQSRRRKIQNSLDKGGKVGLSPNDPHFMTNSLSGGNQQKVILAKWLSTDAEVFIFDEPTKGIDVGAKAEIYALMEDLVEHGKSIIMVSSELPEVIGMSDRIIVMRSGRVVAEVAREDFTEDLLLKYAVGEGAA